MRLLRGFPVCRLSMRSFGSLSCNLLCGSIFILIKIWYILCFQVMCCTAHYQTQYTTRHSKKFPYPIWPLIVTRDSLLYWEICTYKRSSTRRRTKNWNGGAIVQPSTFPCFVWSVPNFDVEYSIK